MAGTVKLHYKGKEKIIAHPHCDLLLNEYNVF
jgi:hypothetical protein